MYGGSHSWRYIIGFVLTIILLIVVIVLIINHGGGKGKLPVTQKPLVSYSSDNNFMVRETIDGQINAPSEHNQLQITVTNSNTTFTLLKGYEGQVATTQQFDNNTPAFKAFLSALEQAGFTKGDTDSTLKSGLGYCPTGNRYTFEAMDGSKQLESFWSNSCNSPKTFKGNTNLVLGLFQAQIPGYDTLIRNYTNNADFGFHL